MDKFLTITTNDCVATARGKPVVILGFTVSSARSFVQAAVMC